MSQPSHVHDLTQGNIIKQIWSLAWPLMLSMFFYTLYSIVDTFWVGKLSSEAIAAVSISQVTLFVMVALSMGIAVGSGVVMARHIGAKNTDKAEQTLAQSFVLSTAFAVFFTVISLVFRTTFLQWSGAVGAIFDPAMVYFTITAAGSVLFFWLMNIMFAFNSEGDTMTLAKLFILSTLVNLVLDPVLIFGKLGLPAMGISGAAYATLISQLVFVLVGIKILSSSKRRIRFRFRKIGVVWSSVKEVLRIGIPASLSQVIMPVGLAAMISAVSKFFAEAGATAFSLIFRLEFFAYLPAAGFGMAAMAMIGQNIGAGKRDRASQVYKKAIMLGLFSATGLGLLLMLLGKPMISAFTQDAEVIKYCLSYIWIVAGSYGLLAVGMIVVNTFQAMGKSWPGFWLFVLKFFVISLPLSYLLINNVGQNIRLVWLSVLLGNIIMAATGYVWQKKTLRL